MNGVVQMAIMQDRSVEGEAGFGKCPWCGSQYELQVLELTFNGRRLSNVSRGRCRSCVPKRIVYSAAQLLRAEAALNGDTVDPSLLR